MNKKIERLSLCAAIVFVCAIVGFLLPGEIGHPAEAQQNTFAALNISQTWPALQNFTGGLQENGVPVLTSGIFSTLQNFSAGIQSFGLPVATATGTIFPGDCTSWSSATPPVITDAGTCGGTVSIFTETSTFHMRAVLTAPQSTATCTASSNTCTFASVTGFQIGDGAVIYKAGQTNTVVTMPAPTAVTVTPSLRTGPDPNADKATAPAGSVSASYTVVARTKNGGLTAQSTAGTTSTGWTLGNQQATVSNLARANNVVTVTLASALPCAVNGWLFITNSNDASFSGDYQIASCNGSGSPANTTTLTYLQGQDTRGGCVFSFSSFTGCSTNSAAGGTAQVSNGNYLSWTASAVTGTGAVSQYYICKSGSLVGATRSNETYWMDLGTSAPTLPDFAGCPAGVSNDYFTSTITGITGNQVTFTSAVSNSVSSAEVKFDDVPTFRNALTATCFTAGLHAPLHISWTNGQSYFFNSNLTWPCVVPLNLLQEGQIVVNETMTLYGETIWNGTIGTYTGQGGPFAIVGGPQIIIGSAYPGILAGNGTTFKQTNWIVPAQGIGLVEYGFNGIFQDSNCGLEAGDVNGLCILGLGAANIQIQNASFTGPDSVGYGYTITPLLLFRDDIAGANPSGDIFCNNCFFTGRGMGYDATPLVGGFNRFVLDNAYAQALLTPLVIGGQQNSVSVTINAGFTNDTSSQAAFANLNPFPYLSPQVSIQNVENSSSESGGGQPGILTGNPIYGANATNGGANVGQNTNITYTANDMLVNHGGTFQDASLQVTANLQMYTPASLISFALSPPAGVAVTPASGGTLAAGTNTYQVTSYDVLGNETVGGNQVVCITTSGTQTCNLTWSAVPYAASYGVVWDGVTHKASHITTTSYSDTTPGCCNNGAPFQTTAGTTAITATQIFTPQLNQPNANDYAGASACVTSTKAITFPANYASAPVVIVFDYTTKGGANLSAGPSVSGFTVSCTGATDSFGWVAIGNPN